MAGTYHGHVATRSTKTTTKPRPARSAAALGPNVRATLATIDAIGADPATNAVAALALHLAGVLDSGEARSQVANVARELRACLAELAHAVGTGPDELDDLLAELRGQWSPADPS
jgi:hypothetical protein